MKKEEEEEKNKIRTGINGYMKGRKRKEKLNKEEKGGRKEKQKRETEEVEGRGKSWLRNE